MFIYYHGIYHLRHFHPILHSQLHVTENKNLHNV